MKQSYEEMIEVLKAAAEGKTIQARYDGNATWGDIEGHEPVWDFSFYEYRVKPEQVTVYVNVYETDYGSHWSYCYPTGEAARFAANDPKVVAIAVPIIVPEESLACI